MYDEHIAELAIQFAHTNGKNIAERVADVRLCPPDPRPVSIFMAGSPGAGKTEYSKSIQRTVGSTLRIDGDDLRTYFPEYTGTNSSCFQAAISILVEKIHGRALHQKQSFILDGTLAKYDKAARNIQRSLACRRSVVVFYIYQDPCVAWRFTQQREKIEGRNIPKEAFINQFLGAQATIRTLRDTFGPEVTIVLITKNFEQNTAGLAILREKGNEIDQYLPETYTRDALEKMI